MSKIVRLRINFVRRNARKGGPAYSKLVNDSIDELSADLTTLAQQWNDYLVPLLSSLPAGTTSEDGLTSILDAYTDGLDGSTLYVEADATSTTDSVFYNATQERPNSVKEQFSAVYNYVDNTNDDLRDEMASFAGALTEEQKSRIGANIFYPSKTSSSDSLDGLTELNQENVLQLARDIYDADSGFQMDQGGDPQLTYSIRDHIEALLDLHNGAFDSDLDLDHSGQVRADELLGQVPQSGVAKSNTYNDSWSGTAANIEDDLNELRSLLKRLMGVATYKSQPQDYTPANTDIQTVLDWSGTGTRDANNPWGMAFSDLDDEDWQSVNGLSGAMGNVRDFTGMTNFNDGEVVFASTNHVTQGSVGGDLEQAIGELDAALYTHEQDSANPHTVTLTQAAAGGGSAPASQISIVNAALLYDSINVEDALAEVMQDVDQLEIDLPAMSGLLNAQIYTLSGDLHGQILAGDAAVQADVDSLSGILDAHVSDFANPHLVTAAQLGASGIMQEINDNGVTSFVKGRLPSDIVYTANLDSEMENHKIGSQPTLPSLQHWAEDIDCTTTLSGVENMPTLTSSGLDDVIAYTIEGDDFRRYDHGFTSWGDSTDKSFVHSRSVLPIVQVVRYDTNQVIGSGITITHETTTTAFDTVTVTNSTGGAIPSGVILMQW